MKKILLTLSYPFWFFLAKTWLGNVMMIPIVIYIPIIPFHSILNQPVDSYGIGVLFVFLDLILAPIVGGLFIVLSSTMEEEYEKRNWLTQI